MVIGMVFAFALAADQPAKVYKVVLIDGTGFKVTQRGDNVSVVQRGAVFHVPTAQTQKNARLAAEFVTGCTVTDSFLYRLKFKMLVDCAKAATKPDNVEISVIEGS